MHAGILQRRAYRVYLYILCAADTTVHERQRAEGRASVVEDKALPGVLVCPW